MATPSRRDPQPDQWVAIIVDLGTKGSPELAARLIHIGDVQSVLWKEQGPATVTIKRASLMPLDAVEVVAGANLDEARQKARSVLSRMKHQPDETQLRCKGCRQTNDQWNKRPYCPAQYQHYLKNRTPQ